MTQTITETAVEATKAAIMVYRESDSLVNYTSSIHSIPRLGGPPLRQPTFDWKARDRYQELGKFRIEVKNIFMTNNYYIQESKGI